MPPKLRRSIGMILPGYGAANATLRRAGAALLKIVMNSDSPVSTRLPAETSLPMNPCFSAGREPSPKIVVISTPGSM